MVDREISCICCYYVLKTLCLQNIIIENMKFVDRTEEQRRLQKALDSQMFLKLFT